MVTPKSYVGLRNKDSKRSEKCITWTWEGGLEKECGKASCVCAGGGLKPTEQCNVGACLLGRTKNLYGKEACGWAGEREIKKNIMAELCGGVP
jgi:hypothetical protein